MTKVQAAIETELNGNLNFDIRTRKTILAKLAGTLRLEQAANLTQRKAELANSREAEPT